MKKLLAVVLAAMLLTGCAALPGEERSFAVVLGLDWQNGSWHAGARIPTYKNGGEYATVTAEGTSLGEALGMLNAAAPMELHYGQLRLLVLSEALAETQPVPELFKALAERGEVRPQAAVCVTAEKIKDLLDAMEPSAGSRLSKSVEAMLQARQDQGVLPECTLSSLIRMGERQHAVLLNAELEDKAVQLSGGWMTNGHGVTGSLTKAETQLLSLLMGRLKQGTLALEGGTVTLLDTDCSIRLKGNAAHCMVRLRYGASTMTEEGVRQAITAALQGMTAKLADAGCDALGLGRQAMLACADMTAWRELNWPERYPSLEWIFDIRVEREA